MAELEGRALDRYELRRLIGKGGMANVYEAYDPSFHRVVAVKVFKREDEEMLHRFIREAQVMAGLHHPHLVGIYDTGECLLDGVMRYYIVMPMLTGGTLRLRIRRQPLSLTDVCQCLNDIAGALDYIHSQGIVHRDIKASNVLLDDEGRCYLTDFGIARITSDATQLTSTGNVLGTVDYVAPELFEVHRRADARSDLYSLGVLLYEMVTGRLPFSADNQLALISMHVNKRAPSPRLYVPQITGAIERVILRALEKQPEMRYESATALAEAFCRSAEQDPVHHARSGGEAAAVALGPPQASAASPPVHPSPLARGTEGFVLSPVPPVASDGRRETPLPAGSRRRVPAAGRPSAPRRGLLLAFLALAALVIIAVPTGYAVFNRHAPATPTAQASGATGTPSPAGQPSPDLTQTALATASAQGTAEARATATAVAGVQLTAGARASATAGPIQTATAGQPAYQDPLNNSNNPLTAAANWDQDGQCNFASDGYHVTQAASFPYFKGCREQNNSYGNLALTVDVDLLSGHSGGVFFRLGTNFIGNYDGYLFEIDSQGHYKISREQGAGITALKDWGPDPALHTGYHVSNHLQVLARGTTLLFYANGTYLTTVQNDYYSRAGGIGFLATSVSGGSDTEVVYSNLQVYAL
jgi:tRNA A-37 threonylcarbamoyl transferase component Bud32